MGKAVSAASHSLDTGWTGYQVKSVLSLREEYEKYAVHGACEGVDILGKWWDVRLSMRSVVLSLVRLTGAEHYSTDSFVCSECCGSHPHLRDWCRALQGR